MSHHANVLVADPPWAFGDKLPGNGRGSEKHYKVLTVPDIMRFQLPPLEDDAMLVLWRVASQQQEALDVVKAWDFVVKSEIVWVKSEDADDAIPKMGMGHYVRNEHEVALVCTRGKFKVADHGVRSTFRAPRGTHSSKPDAFFALVERLAGPEREGHLVELFGRKARVGWHVYGDEIPQGYVWTPRPTGGPANPTTEIPSAKPGAISPVNVSDGWAVAIARANAEPEQGACRGPGGAHRFGPCGGDGRMRCDDCGVWKHEDGTLGSLVEASVKAKESKTREGGPLPAHVIPELGEHPAVTDEDTRGLFLARALRENLLSNEDIAEGPADAWIKLQYRAPSGWFREGPNVTKKSEIAQTVARHTNADTLPGENVGRLVFELAQRGFDFKLTDVVTWPVVRRDVARAWIEQGGDPPEWLVELFKSAEPLSETIVVTPPEHAGEFSTNGHAVASTASEPAKRGRGRPRKPKNPSDVAPYAGNRDHDAQLGRGHLATAMWNVAKDRLAAWEASGALDWEPVERAP